MTDELGKESLAAQSPLQTRTLHFVSQGLEPTEHQYDPEWFKCARYYFDSSKEWHKGRDNTAARAWLSNTIKQQCS